jgi:aminoglycoside phosphotransferase (APT) family kinase protein
MSAAEDTFSGVKPVEERHRFDEAALAAWMDQHVEGFQGPLSVSQFKGGQSNPTYRLDAPGQAYVLRRKPFGPLLPSAHAVDREFRVISALHGAGFPVARPYALCQDDAVIGAWFYIMSMVEGRVFWNASMPGKSPAERRAIFEAEIATLARLHQTDYAGIGLGDYGRPGNYFARQVERWTRQYRAAEIDPIPEMDRLIEWLPATVPPQERTSIVHGDYRMDNMIFDAAEPRVAAVLDWELSTIGDPLADFSYLMMNWHMPGDGRSGLGGLDLEALGIPTLDEAVELYCRLTGRPGGVPDLNWYFAFGLFRLCSITQGIAKRVQIGTAASERARETAARTPHLAAASWEFAKKAGA